MEIDNYEKNLYSINTYRNNIIKNNFENSFYCAEFVKYVLDKSDTKNNLPEMIRTRGF